MLQPGSQAQEEDAPAGAPGRRDGHTAMNLPRRDDAPPPAPAAVIAGAARTPRARSYALLATGLLACPCHIPLWIGLVSATAGGAFLLANLAWLVPALLAYSLAALMLGWHFLRRAEACERRPAHGP